MTAQENTMKAVVHDSYGSPDVLRLREIDIPAVGDDEVLVRVRAASVHPDVWHVVSGRPYVLRLMGAGLRRPRNPVPGTDVAGHVESVGKSVTRFKPGDEVFGETLRGNQWRNGGAFAEYVCAPQDGLALKPAGVTFEQAAAVPTSALIALQHLPAKRLRPGGRVLVNGAGGGVGSFAVQIAKAYGATVIGVDHGAKLDMVRSLGADRVIDYTQEDFTRAGERYDLIFDVPGNHSFADCRRVLTPEGTYVLIGHDHFGGVGGRWLGSLPHFSKLMALSLFRAQLPKPSSPPSREESMAVLAELLETGKLTPIVGRTYPLSEVPEAIRHLVEGEAQGKIVITV
ncbi:NAD(P)-dependent alcohol dehydrogenase [Sphaerisporangium sp. TRM90804]|uniref:NAD(P)-dependent alcohol dehydrogenase n=1 Tax=Sphaerisporangium sp. TRM90804 TaxID=3031113 RepID=UPI00244A87F9|nr:NAD(P)-dependent alcohol dehydrogenase [Sphaerisporangium sp. TRM90804]MDH2426900.1 NAD(P)-dependent alcohol dehydrogenase [Sphaerisporangium sp. TRM90804]